MKYLKIFENYILSELIQSRDNLINVDKSEIKNFIEPALMTSDEYYKLVNPSNKWHDEDVYNFTLDSNERSLNLENLKLIKQKKIGKVNIDFYLEIRPTTYGYYENPEEDDYSKKNWIKYTDQEKKEKGLPLNSYDVVAVHRDEKIRIGGGQDEWGAVLVWVIQEYRGMGIGAEIVKIYREYYPSKESGGFTTFGYEQAKKYHAYLVRKYLMNGIYSDMIKKGEITKEKVKGILDSIKEVKRFSKTPKNPLVDMYGDSGKYSLYFDKTFVVIYDPKLAKYNDIDYKSSLKDLIFKKAIKAYISVIWDDHSGNNFFNLYATYAENKKFFKDAMDIMLSMCEEGISDKYYVINKRNYFKELEYLKELSEDGFYKKEIFKKYEHEFYNIFTIKNPIKNIGEIQKLINQRFIKNDPYGEIFTTIIDATEGYYMDYLDEEESKHLFKNSFDILKRYSLDEEWFKTQTKRDFVWIFKQYFGTENWNKLDNKLKNKFSDQVDDYFDQKTKEYKIK